jgi:sialate O-acetylesterase
MTRLSPARLFAALALAYSEARGAILLPSHIASSMVLQSGTPVPIWGLDAPGASVTAVFGGKALPPVTCDSTGRFDVVLPASPVSGAPTTLQLSSSSGSAAVTLSDIVVGTVWVCSGQSNMGLSIANVAEVQEVLADSSALGPLLRVFQVALLDEYANATSPQSNLTASIPWSRASPASVPGMSALCYLTAAKAVAARGGVPARYSLDLMAEEQQQAMMMQQQMASQDPNNDPAKQAALVKAQNDTVRAAQETPGAGASGGAGEAF